VTGLSFALILLEQVERNCYAKIYVIDSFTFMGDHGLTGFCLLSVQKINRNDKVKYRDPSPSAPLRVRMT
jgi:hypothetical protein